MGSLAGQVVLPADAPPADAPADATTLPELNDADYVCEVFRISGLEARASAEEHLATKAKNLGIRIPDPADTSIDHRNTSSADSQNSTVVTAHHARTCSTASYSSVSTALTAPSLQPDLTDSEASSHAATMKRARNLSFSSYDKYLAQIDPNLDQPKFLKSPPQEPPDTSGRSLFSVNTRRSYVSIKESFRKIRWKKKTAADLDRPIACICCRDDFNKSSALHHLPCGHTYCGECLKVMVQQSTTDESKFPPRCCTQPIPSSVLKDLLNQSERHKFLKAVRLYSTPWEARIFCPNLSCSEFIPPRSKIDPKHPFDVVCRKCSTRVCIMCKNYAHPIGKECPEDWELNEVLKIGEKSGWRRCYKCRALVELTQGCTHITCRCKAQFCYLCGAIWNPTVGCPNFCDGVEELERREQEEQQRVAALEAEEAAVASERAAAERRTRENAHFSEMRDEMREQSQRFLDFVSKRKWLMEARHSGKKQATVERFADQVEKMQERHVKTATHLEERQVEAEMELRETLKQSEKSVKIRLKHMEAYCDGLGRHPDRQGLPPRTVTERDLRELGQQYNLRDDLERLHQAKINVLRDRQAKRMEELQGRQVQEMEKLMEKRDKEMESLAGEFAQEEDMLANAFAHRKGEMLQRWELKLEVLRRELEVRDGVTYARMELPPWPGESDLQDPIISAAAAEADAEADDDAP